MRPRAPECPSCGSGDTEFAETVWETGPKDRDSNVAPPVPRDATTNFGRFYAWGVVWLIITVLITLFLRHHAAYRVESVLEVTILGVMAGIYQIHRLLTGHPRPTEDQEAAMAEWHLAHAEWERLRVCRNCGKTFTPDE